MENEKLQQNQLSGYIGRLLREAFGKGPQSVFISLRRPFIVIYLRNFLSPPEKILLQQNQTALIQKTRELIMKTLVPDIKAYLLLHAGMNIQEFYYDWVLQNESGVFVGIEAEDERGLPALQQSYTGKKALHNDIDQLYQRVQKESDDDTYSCMMNEKTILVVRRNILSFMEKEMVRIGREEELKLAKRSLEKPLLDNNRRFEQLLNKKIVDIFADWNFVLDKCVIVIILNQNIVL